MLEIFIPLILILTGFPMSKIQFLFDSTARELAPGVYSDGGSERLIINKNVVNPAGDAELEARDESILADQRRRNLQSIFDFNIDEDQDEDEIEDSVDRPDQETDEEESNPEPEPVDNGGSIFNFGTTENENEETDG